MIFVIFFFQAEDGIRDKLVTGVQTCALPISEEVLLSLTPGMFTGEATMLSGRPGLAQIRAGADGEVIEVARDDLLALIQTDGELSAIFMRAFILRRGGRVTPRRYRRPGARAG